MPNVTEIKNINNHLEEGAIESADILSGDGIIVAPGPPLLDDDTITAELLVIGLLQGADVVSNKGVSTVGELGTVKKYIISMRGTKSITFSRLETEDNNALKAIYSFMINLDENSEWVEGTDYPSGPIWKNLDHPLFKKSFGLSLTFLDGQADKREIIGKLYLENCLIANIGNAGSEGQKGVIDNLTIMWSNTKYEPFDTEDNNG
jgi:hypothetical protein